jgi:hypothetical protein
LKDFEKHAAAALADLGSRATELTAQRQTIEAVLAKAERAQNDALYAEARLAALTDEGELRSVRDDGCAPGRTGADAAARLQRVVKKKDDLGRGLATRNVSCRRWTRRLNAISCGSRRHQKCRAPHANGSVPSGASWPWDAVGRPRGARYHHDARRRTESSSSLDTSPAAPHRRHPIVFRHHHDDGADETDGAEPIKPVGCGERTRCSATSASRGG